MKSNNTWSDTVTEATPPLDDRTLHVYVGEADRLREQTKARLRAAEADENVQEIGNTHVLTVESEADLARIVSPANLELLRTIRRQDPPSMRVTATLVDRDYKEVHRNLTELYALGVIELVQDGRAKRPLVRYDEIEVHYSLAEPKGDHIEEPA